jgi:hypothetical protein
MNIVTVECMLLYNSSFSAINKIKMADTGTSEMTATLEWQ